MQAEVVDKHPTPTYYSRIMASDRIQRQIEHLLDEVEDGISRYDWEAVRQATNAVLAIDPENSDGRTYLTTAERAMGGSAPTPTGHPAVSTPITTATATPA